MFHHAALIISASIVHKAESAVGAASMLSGAYYLVTQLVQIKLYGLRKYWELGLGTGVKVHEKEKKALADFEQAAEKIAASVAARLSAVESEVEGLVPAEIEID